MKKRVVSMHSKAVVIWLCVLWLSTSLPGQIKHIDEETVLKWRVENNVPAVGIGIIENGKVQYVKVFGELKKGVPAPDNAIFGVASMTKPVVAMLTLKLVQAGKWDLDGPLFHHWVDPDVANDPRHRQLTTRHVLSHQTGFRNWRRNHPTKKLTFEFDPGTEYLYSGEGFVYLQRALERKFKKSLVQLSDSILFMPLGMKDTRYYWDKNMDGSRFAFWHDAEGNLHEPASPKERGIGAVNAAGSLLTTVEDYCKFCVDVMNGAGLSADLFNDLISPQVKVEKHKYHGLGWGIVKDLPNGEYALEHGGSNPGEKTQAVFLPKSKRGIVVLTNGDGGLFVHMNVVKESFDIGDTLLNYMMGTPPTPEIIALSDEILEGYVGTYTSAEGGDLFVLTKESGALKISNKSNPPVAVYPSAENKFFAKLFDIQCEFFKDSTGQTVRMTIIQGGRIIFDTKKIK